MHKLVKTIAANTIGSEALIGCLVFAFTIRFLVINPPRKRSDKSAINIFSIIFSPIALLRSRKGRRPLKVPCSMLCRPPYAEFITGMSKIPTCPLFLADLSAVSLVGLSRGHEPFGPERRDLRSASAPQPNPSSICLKAEGFMGCPFGPDLSTSLSAMSAKPNGSSRVA